MFSVLECKRALVSHFVTEIMYVLVLTQVGIFLGIHVV